MANPPLPTYESLAAARQTVWPSPDFFRLRWRLSGPLSTHINVLASAVDATSPQTPYQPSPSTFHPISSSPLSDPPISSITVTINPLDEWAEAWGEAHHGDIGGNQEWDPQEEEEDSTTTSRRLIRCCGEERPGPGPSLTVSASGGRPFVTVHDYVMTVHPWLMGLDAEIRAAIGVFGVPLPARFDVHVLPYGLSPVLLLDSKTAGPRALESQWRAAAAAVARLVG